jgi:hypothetical protein
MAMDDLGAVYMPAAFFGDERQLLMSAIWDSKTMACCHHSGHVYLSADWLSNEFPAKAAEIAAVAARVRGHLRPTH